MVKIARITIYPFKSLDGLLLDQAELLPKGSLKQDRQFALTDEHGTIINAKRTDQIHRLESKFDLEHNQIWIKERKSEKFEKFDLTHDIPNLEKWFSHFFDQEINLIKNSEQGFPDDTESPGPTIISTGTLETIASWFGFTDLNEVRNRFRANIELNGCAPFWEDQLYADLKQAIQFQMGDMEWLGINPCARCVVPTRSPLTGEKLSGFQKTFAEYRKNNLPKDVSLSRWTHFYRLSVNTCPQRYFEGGTLKIGDEVKILGTESYLK